MCPSLSGDNIAFTGTLTKAPAPSGMASALGYLDAWIQRSYQEFLDSCRRLPAEKVCPMKLSFYTFVAFLSYTLQLPCVSSSWYNHIFALLLLFILSSYSISPYQMWIKLTHVGISRSRQRVPLHCYYYVNIAPRDSVSTHIATATSVLSKT